MTIDEMKNIDVSTVDKSTLVDISTININPKDPPEKKFRDFVEQIKNPYCFLCNGYAVKLSFSDNGKTLEDCFMEYIDTLV